MALLSLILTPSPPPITVRRPSVCQSASLLASGDPVSNQIYVSVTSATSARTVVWSVNATVIVRAPEWTASQTASSA